MKFDVTSFYNRRATNRAERVAVGDILERVTWSFPHKEAIVALEGGYAGEKYHRVSYKVANQTANQFANGLLEKGLKRGERVLFYCLNSVEYFLAQSGTAKSGLVAVPVNVMLANDLLDYIIKQTEPKFLVVDAELCPKARKVFEENNLDVGVTIPIGGEVVEGSKSFEEFIAGKPKSEPEVEIHGDDIFQILYTAGTTALPKGVMQSHIYMYFCATDWAISNAQGVRTEIDYRQSVFYPIFHIAGQGMTYAALIVGGTAVMTRKPDPKLMVEAISREKITAAFGSPLDFYQIADAYEKNPGKYDSSNLKAISYGWSSFRPDYDRKLKKIFGQDLLIIGNDGQTECVYDTRMWHHKWYETYEKNEPALNYFGVPHPFYATTIMNEKGEICPPQVMGEKVMRSPVMMAGYYKNEKATKEAFKFGWFHGGDAAMYDDNGLMIMVDRYKDIIKSGGETVSSIRVEQMLIVHPKVAQVAVIGLPHNRWLEAVTACVVPVPGEDPTEEELINFCRERLGGYERPKKIVFMEELPATVGGKIQKFILRKKLKDLYKDE